MTDHDAIAAHARRCPATDPDAAGAAAYLDLYDEVTRLKAERRLILDERDRTFALVLACADKAEAERDTLQNALAGRGEELTKAWHQLEAVTGERDALRAALDSIANNTCCEGCQEAALVARQALKGQTND